MSSGCSVQRQSSHCYLQHAKTDEILRIKGDIDLSGQTIDLPQGITLIAEGGRIFNGTIVGNDTRIKGKTALFDHVTIQGSWIVPKISTDLFYNLKYNNSLRDVFALTSSDLKNEVVIKHGEYVVTANTSGGPAITMASNTKVHLHGYVRLTPNNFDVSYVLLINGCENVEITGDGTVAGDKNEHKGKTGEWGMGIHVVDSKNVEISGITVKDCWGDCIYIGKESSNISIHDCILDNGRRQGISITSAKRVLVSDCIITNVYGSAPEYAIDIEPNKFQTVEDVTIKRVKAADCGGGILLYGNASDAIIKNVTIQGCLIAGKSWKVPISFSDVEDVVLNACTVETAGPTAISIHNAKDITLSNNSFTATDEVVQLMGFTKLIDRGNIVYRNRR